MQCSAKTVQGLLEQPIFIKWSVRTPSGRTKDVCLVRGERRLNKCLFDVTHFKGPLIADRKSGEESNLEEAKYRGIAVIAIS